MNEMWSKELKLTQNKICVELINAPLGGILIFSYKEIIYTNYYQLEHFSDPFQYNIMSTVKIDDDRVAYADSAGNLNIVMIEHNNIQCTNLRYTKVGEISIPNALVYLKKGLLFISSIWEDPQIVKFRNQLIETESGKKNFIQVVNQWKNFGINKDASMLNLDYKKKIQLVTCNGLGRTGVLNILRGGIEINIFASIEMPGVRGIWSLKKKKNKKYDTYLVKTFKKETKISIISENGLKELDRKSSNYLTCSKPTLLISNLINDIILQVCFQEIKLLKSPTFTLLQSLPTPVKITKVCHSATQVIISTVKNHLLYYELNKQCYLVQKQIIKLKKEIMCFSMNPKSVNNKILVLCSYKNNSIQLLTLPNLKQVFRKNLNTNTLPISIKVVIFGKKSYVLLGMSDGKILMFILKSNFILIEVRHISIGRKSVNLSIFSHRNQSYIFAFCDRPTLITNLKDRIKYKNLDQINIKYAVQFYTKDFKSNILFYAKDELLISYGIQFKNFQLKKIPTKCFWPKNISFCSGPPMTGYLVAGDITHFGDRNSKFLLKFFDEDLEDIDSLKFYSNYIIQDLCFIVTNLMSLFIIASKKIKSNKYFYEGRLDLIHFNKQKQLHQLGRFETMEEINCISNLLQNYFTIGINDYIELYYICPETQNLKLIDSVKIHFRISFIKTFNNIILVGDNLSVSNILFQFDNQNKKLICLRNNTDTCVPQIMNIKQKIFCHYMNGFEVLNIIKKNINKRFDHVQVKMKITSKKLFLKPEYQIFYGNTEGNVLSYMGFNNSYFKKLNQLQKEILLYDLPIIGLKCIKFREIIYFKQCFQKKFLIHGDILENYRNLNKFAQIIVSRILEISNFELLKLIINFSKFH